ncbi:protein-L-isoaspartate O-methyltransferase [Streptomyces sp. JJ66]|uniref:protein-L-isoaspartate O-methyltransferase n=1 Tax=Streptomyces sp. JJ66 TaxID=2803843 RepID=UPI001C5602E8|nr:protein-L-isoaspartate O-methyltransferase [Streptomyces sp. JJ66]MBW1600991.1 protein-L-isoaspartate O-methyltransferase [Streptomyces sp. JJ66]
MSSPLHPPQAQDRAGVYRLATHLIQGRHVQMPAWIAAVKAVPRQHFVPAYLTRCTGRFDVPSWEPFDAETHRPTWLANVYSDRALVVETDPLSGEPTCTSTMPSVSARMLEESYLSDGHRILEIGTGTGYPTALLCHRLGDGRVCSMDINPARAVSATRHLAACGYRPQLATGDGRKGWPDGDGGGFERLISWCSVTTIPAAWLRQTHPKAVILTGLGNSLGSGICRLTHTGNGTASGGFLPGPGALLPARSNATGYDVRPKAPYLPPTEGIRESPLTAADLLHRDTFRLLAGFALTDVALVQHRDANGGAHVQLQHPDGSWARTPAPGEPDTGYVTWGGPRQLWDELETVWATWRHHGQPGPHPIGISITPDRQRVWLHSPLGPSWTLPTPTP